MDATNVVPTVTVPSALIAGAAAAATKVICACPAAPDVPAAFVSVTKRLAAPFDVEVN